VRAGQNVTDASDFLSVGGDDDCDIIFTCILLYDTERLSVHIRDYCFIKYLQFYAIHVVMHCNQ
jgi:hypothetical protein